MSDWSSEDKLGLAMQRVRQLGKEKQSRPIMAKITSEYENGYISVIVRNQSVEVFFEKAIHALEPGESSKMDCIASFTFGQLMGHEAAPAKPIESHEMHRS